MHKFNEELIKAGIRRAADDLKPSLHGRRIAFDGDSRMVIDGPFAAPFLFSLLLLVTGK